MEMNQPVNDSELQSNFEKSQSISAPRVSFRYSFFFSSHRLNDAVSLMWRAPQPPGFSPRG